jgi:tetratricopeptide (TPR) repeat protein
LRLLPTYTQAYLNRAAEKAALKDWAGELADAQKASQLAPANSDAYDDEARALINLQRLPEAQSVLDHALRLMPRDAYARINRCNVRLIFHDYRGAQEDCTQAIAADPSLTYAYLDRGIARYDLQDRAGAVANLTYALHTFERDGNTSAAQTAKYWLLQLGQ